MEKNYNKTETLNKMRNLRNFRDGELQDLNKGKVLDVKYLGSIKYGDNEKGVYLIIEENQKEDETTIEVERYYTEDGEFLGGNNRNDAFNFIVLDEKHQNEQEVLKQLEEMDKEGLEDLNQIEDERIEEIAKSLGISKEEIEKLCEIDVEEKERDKENKEDVSKRKGKSKQNKEEKETLSKEEVEKISTKSEIKTNTKVTDKETIAELLNVQSKGYKSIGIVYSDKLKENGNNTRFSIVGIKEDGSAEKIDTLEQGYGSNPSKKINSLNREGNKVEEEQVNSIFRVKGKKETELAVDIGSMGTIEASLVRTPNQDNKEAISIPIETQSIKPVPRESRELMNETKNPRTKEEIEKIKEHQEVGCDDITIKDIDDNEYNDTHTHIEIDEEYLNKCADIILENDEIASVYNRNDVIEKISANIKNTDHIDTDELIKATEEEMEEMSREEYHGPEHQR